MPEKRPSLAHTTPPFQENSHALFHALLYTPHPPTSLLLTARLLGLPAPARYHLPDSLSFTSSSIPTKYCLKRRIFEHYLHLYMASRALPQAISNDWSNKLMHIATAPSSSFAPCFVSTVQWIPPTERIAQSME